MEFFNNLPGYAKVMIIIVFIFVTTINLAIVLMAPNRINAIQSKENIGYKTTKLSKGLNYAFYGMILLWYVFAIIKNVLTTIFILYIAAMILYFIYRLTKKMKERETKRDYPLYYTKNLSSDFYEEFHKSHSNILFNITPNGGATAVTIIESDIDKHTDILKEVSQLEEMFENLSDKKFQVNELTKQKVLFIVLGIYLICAFFVLFATTVL